MTRPVIAVTTGEPAGIGPEVSIRAAWALRETIHTVLIGDGALLIETATAIDTAIRLKILTRDTFEKTGLPPAQADCLTVLNIPLAAPAIPGTLDVRNARPVLAMLDCAIDNARAGLFQAITTAPLQKSVINDAGVPFTGHTEYFAERTATKQVVMMLAGQMRNRKSASWLRVALATTHLPLAAVAQAITRDSLLETLRILDADLRNKFGIAQPRILVTGLNPHAGEGGHLGREEIELISPALETARTLGIAAQGPYPADTLFQPKHLDAADCVLVMYHDQGLPVLKFATFGEGINITLGLPFVRTSVDHGTALDLAARGMGHADDTSMKAALQLAGEMATVRRP